MDADSPLPGPSKESRRGAQKGWHGKTVREVSWVVLHDKRQAKREEHAGKDRVAQPAAPPEPVATVGRKGVVVKPARVPGKKGVRESQQAAAEKKASEWTVVEPKKRRPRGGPVQFEERYTVVNKSLRGAHPSRLRSVDVPGVRTERKHYLVDQEMHARPPEQIAFLGSATGQIAIHCDFENE